MLAVILPTHANAATEVTTLTQLEAALGRDETEIIIKNDIQLSTALTIHTDVIMHSDENGPYRILRQSQHALTAARTQGVTNSAIFLVTGRQNTLTAQPKRAGLQAMRMAPSSRIRTSPARKP